ncbi:MAG: hypothetical protein RL885_20805 [Planctomycetota bacterium]
MKPAISAILLLIVVVSGLFVTLELFSERTVGIERPGSADSPEVMRRLEALEASQRSLFERLDRLENPPLERLDRAEPRQVSSDDHRALLEERMRDLESRISVLEGAATFTRDEQPIREEKADLEDHVARALETIRRDEKLVRARAELEKRSEDLEPTVQAWSSWLRLDELQRVRLSDQLRDRVARERELLEAWDVDEDPERIDRRRREIERDFIRSVRGILSPDQVETLSQKFGEDAEGDR